MRIIDKKTFIQFIVRTPMYIQYVNEHTISSFVDGYEMGSQDKCDFTVLVRNHIENKLLTPYDADGWVGQIRRFSNKKEISWITAFKQIGLEIISLENNGLDNKMQQIIKSRILYLVDRINEKGDNYFNESWVEEWRTLCLIKSNWFKSLWTKDEYQILKLIGKLVDDNKVFIEFKPFRPTNKMLELKNKFTQRDK